MIRRRDGIIGNVAVIRKNLKVLRLLDKSIGFAFLIVVYVFKGQKSSNVLVSGMQQRQEDCLNMVEHVSIVL